MDGWIKLYRKIAENPLYFAEPFTRMQAWIDMLVIANYEDSYIYVRGNKIQIKRGQIGKSQDTLAERWKWSRGKVVRFLDELQKSGQIAQQKSKIMSLISVSNYDSYQGVDTTDSTSNGTTDKTTDEATGNTTNNPTDSASDERQTNQQKKQQTDQQTDANKKNKNNINIILSTNADNISSPSNEEEALMRVREAENPAEEEMLIKPTAAPAKQSKQKPLPAKKIQEMWNATCLGYPKIYTISEARKNKIRIRIDEMGGEDIALPLLQILFEKMQASNFLKGDSKRGWKASFDWLFENDKNWVKVHEGNYEMKQPGSGSQPEEPKGRNYDETIF